MSKKGTFSLSVNFIVVIILSLVLLALILSFVQSNFEKTAIKLEEQLVVGAPKPTVEIKYPFKNSIFEVGTEIDFEPFAYMQTKKSKVIGYFWDFNGDSFIDSREEKTKHTYYEPGDYTVILKALNDLGGVGSASIVVRIFTNNSKEISKYPTNLVFLMEPKRDPTPPNEITNWQEISKITPLARWFDRNGDHEYEFMAIIPFGGTLTLDDVEDAIEEAKEIKGNVTEAVFFEDPILSLSLPTYTIRNENANELATYFSYWEYYSTVVLVHSTNKEGSLIASLFAAYLNSPILFIDNSICTDPEKSLYKTYLFGKKFYIVDDITDEVWNCINTWNTDKSHYSSEELRDPSRRVNRIISLQSEISLDT